MMPITQGNDHLTGIHEKSMGITRIAGLSDGVFAVAITLLAFEIKIPVEGNYSNKALLMVLVNQWPAISSYILSFFIVGIYWRAHHRIFQYIEQYDTMLLRINIAQLLLVAFLPLPTSVIGSYPNLTVAVIFYALCVSITGLATLALWLYASHEHRLVNSGMDDLLIRFLTVRFLIAPMIFLLSIGLAFVTAFAPILPGPRLAEYSWILIAVVLTIHTRWHTRREWKLER